MSLAGKVSTSRLLILQLAFREKLLRPALWQSSELSKTGAETSECSLVLWGRTIRDAHGYVTGENCSDLHSIGYTISGCHRRALPVRDGAPGQPFLEVE